MSLLLPAVLFLMSLPDWAWWGAAIVTPFVIWQKCQQTRRQR